MVRSIVSARGIRSHCGGLRCVCIAFSQMGHTVSLPCSRRAASSGWKQVWHQRICHISRWVSLWKMVIGYPGLRMMDMANARHTRRSRTGQQRRVEQRRSNEPEHRPDTASQGCVRGGGDAAAAQPLSHCFHTPCMDNVRLSCGPSRLLQTDTSLPRRATDSRIRCSTADTLYAS